MIVKRFEGPVYHRRQRQSLPGRGVENAALAEKSKSFDQYLLEAFHGEVVQHGNHFADSVSELQKENLIRLSQI